MVIDTPITEANGKSAGSTGQAALSWERVSRVLGDISFVGGEYHFRYRQFGGDTEADHWDPDIFVGGQDGTTINTPISGHTDVITDLAFNKIYAIQLRYEVSQTSSSGATTTTRVYTGRDVYVWPAPPADSGNAKRFPPRGEQLATCPFFGHRPDGELHYKVCENTFSPENMRTEWGNLIKHAFQQWEEAAPDLVTMYPTVGSCGPFGINILPIWMVTSMSN